MKEAACAVTWKSVMIQWPWSLAGWEVAFSHCILNELEEDDAGLRGAKKKDNAVNKCFTSGKLKQRGNFQGTQEEAAARFANSGVVQRTEERALIGFCTSLHRNIGMCCCPRGWRRKNRRMLGKKKEKFVQTLPWSWEGNYHPGLWKPEELKIFVAEDREVGQAMCPWRHIQ